MGQRFELGKEQAQVCFELRAGHLPVDLAPGGELEDEHQQPVQQQDRELVAALARVSQIGNLLKALEQRRQLAAQDTQLPGDGLLARLLFPGYRGVGRAGVG